MAEPYLDSSVVGFNHQDALDARVDTYMRLSPILNMQDAPALTAQHVENMAILQDGPSDGMPNTPKIDLPTALISTDPMIKQNALIALEAEKNKSIANRANLGASISTPRSAVTDKFMTKQFGFSALRDDEDFYWKNEYMDDGALWRNTKNVAGFVGRVASGAALKLMGGLGYVGSLVTSIGSDNYWADVADNGMSKWFEEQEQYVKDQVIPVYKKAGFDEAGFFSKMFNPDYAASFWTDSVADGVAFMASAAIPGLGFSKLGSAVGGFGKAFSTATKLGRAASKFGVGSAAELTSWTFNTAMESAFEGAGVFKEVSKRLKDERDAGLNNLTDEDIRQRAGNLAGNTVLGNMAVLSLSNAWENKLFFKGSKTPTSRAAVELGKDFKGVSADLNQLANKSIMASIDITNPLRRFSYYGKKLGEGLVMEGLWEENAQLAIQRMNQNESAEATIPRFWEQMTGQTYDAFFGESTKESRETAESIGLGALIGMGAGVGFSKVAGERKAMIQNTKNAISQVDAARQNVLNTNDIYKRDENNNVVFDEDNKPVLDPLKLKNKETAYKQFFKDAAFVNSDEYFNSDTVKFETARNLANYVRALNNLGHEGIGQKFADLDPQNATLFGLDPSNLNEQSAAYKSLAEDFEDASKATSRLDMGVKPDEITPADYQAQLEDRKAMIYRAKTDYIALDRMVSEKQSQLLTDLNAERTLSNASLSQFPVEHINTLLYKQKLNEQVIAAATFVDKSDIDQAYYKERNENLKKEIAKYKKDNELSFKDTVKQEDGFYAATVELDDNVIQVIPNLPAVNKKIKDIAAMQNVQHGNKWAEYKLTDPEKGHENYLAYKQDKIAKILDKLADKAEAETKKSDKVRELVPGDFDKVTKLVAKMVFGQNQVYSSEERQLQENYAELVATLLPQYEQMIENQRLKNLDARLSLLQAQNDQLRKLIPAQQQEAEKAETELTALIEELQALAAGDKVNQKRLAESINALQDKLLKFDKWFESRQKLFAQQEVQINALQQEIEGGDFRGLYGALEELKKEKEWVASEITTTKNLIDKLAATLKALIRAAYKLFGNKSAYHENLKEGKAEAVIAAMQQTNVREAAEEAKALLPQLEEDLLAITAKYNENKQQIDAIIAQTNKIYRDYYVDLTKAPVTPADNAEIAITNSLNGQIPPGHGTTNNDTEAGFDGATYQRPLDTKFYTTTFPHIIYGTPTKEEEELITDKVAVRYQDLNQTEKDYFEMVDFYTNPKNAAEIKKKLGNSVLKAIVVTSSNVESLGLNKILNKDKFFNVKDPALTHFELVPVISSPDGFDYYVDAKLNKIGKVSDKAPTKKIVSRSMRRATYTDKEIEQYSIKYPDVIDSTGKVTKSPMAEAATAGTDWRKTMLALTAKDPMHTVEIAITRGIANKQIMQDKTQALNPVIGTLIDEKDVKATTIQVFSDLTKERYVNDEPVTFPPGRPFIVTNNGFHEQFHAANNAKLTPEQVATVTAVFKQMFTEHIATVMDIVNKDKTASKFKEAIEKAGSIEALDATTKKQLYLHLTKSKVRLYNLNYTKYLSSVVYFAGVQKGKEPGDNQIHFKGYNLVFGDKRFDSTDIRNLSGADFQQFLAGQFHNVKYFTTPEKAGVGYTEYYLDKGKLATRNWKNYATYLIDEYLPGKDKKKGEKRPVIPITTAIKSEEQHKALDTTDPYFQYVSRGITVLVKGKPIIKKTTPVTKKGTEKTKKGKEDQPSNISPKSPLARMYAKQAGEEIDEQEEAETEGAEEDTENKGLTIKKGSPMERMMAKQEAARKAGKGAAKAPAKPIAKTPKKPVPEEVEEEVDNMEEFEEIELEDEPTASFGQTPTKKGEPKQDADEDDIDYDTEHFRVASGGVFKTEKDLDAVLADVKRMLPKFNIERLKHVIKTSKGVEAWGQFIDNTIKVFEGAEEGTAYHETFEAVANRILTDKEWSAVQREFNAREGYFTDRPTGTRLRYKDANPQQVKEELAEEFRDYKLTGNLPNRPQARSYFKILWDFIKSLFGDMKVINSLFRDIDKGKFASSPIRNKDRFASNLRFKGIDPQIVQDLYDGATATMFQQMFNTPESIADIDEIESNSKEIYEPIRARFVATVETLKQKIKDTNKPDKKEEYQDYINNLNYALDRWKQFTDDHIQYLKKFRIRFESVEDLEKEKDDTTDSTNRNDYAAGDFKVDGKKSASKSIKFLFGTLMQLQFDPKGGSRKVNDYTVGKTGAVKSKVFLEKLVNYDDMMLNALEEFKGMNDFSMVEAKMRYLAGIDALELLVDPVTKEPNVAKQAEVISSMTPQQATWTNLYTRVFGKADKVSEEAALKLKVKFHNYVSKFSPEPYVLINTGNSSTFISSTKRSFYESLVRKIEGSIGTHATQILKKNADKEWVSKLVPGLGIAEFVSRDYKTKREAFIQFLGIQDYINEDTEKELTTRELNTLNLLLLNVRNTLASPKLRTKTLSIKGLDIDGFTTDLFNFLDKVKGKLSKAGVELIIGEKSTQMMGINNEMRQMHITPSFMSRIISDMNNVADLDALIAKYPHLGNPNAQASVILGRLFNLETGERTGKTVSMGYVEGIKDLDDQEGTGTAKLEFSDKYFQQFNASLQGLYYSLPADSETEWIFNFGEFVPYNENMIDTQGDQIIKDFFIPQLQGEIEMALTSDNSLLQLSGHHKSLPDDITIGQSLRFFKNILGSNKKLISQIHQEIKDGLESTKIIKKHQTAIISATRIYLKVETEKAKQTLLYNKLVVPEGGLYQMRGLNNSFINKVKDYQADEEDQSSTSMTEEQLNSLVEYQKINSIIANMEQFNVLFGDVAQYKDWEKRAKTLFSPIEQTYNDSTGTANVWFNENKNSAILNEDVVELEEGDIFRTDFGNYFNSFTVDDFSVVETDTVNDLHDILETGTPREIAMVNKFIDAYSTNSKGEAQVNETDGQSIGTIGFGRHLMIKSGWRWTKEHEQYYQYDTALMRLELEGKGYSYNGNDALREIDTRIVAYYKDNPPLASLTPVKTLMPFVNAKGQQSMLKHSVHFMSYQIAKEFELLDTYLDMLHNNKQLLNFKSVQKVGLQTDKNGQVSPYYQDPFTKTDLSEETGVGNPIDVIDMRTIGVQVETQTSGKGQTLGSQGTKLINLNLLENGVPTDFQPEIESFSDRLRNFNNLTAEEKLAQSPNWSKIYGPQGTFTTLRNLKTTSALAKFTELGINWKFNPATGNFDYDVNKLDKIRDHILDELQRLEVDSNTIDIIQLTEDLKAFVNPAETIPSYTTISNLLWSIADKSITSMKVNGKSSVQVSSAFFNKKGRKGAYKETTIVEGKEITRWVTVNNKAEYDAAVAAGKKVQMTSSDLKFYTRNKVTGETDAMEVYLPEIYLDKVNKVRIGKGLPELTPQQLMDHLNDNPKLLEGIGFRIPTQATSSLDFFKVKGFLPKAFGSAIVVPSAITTKGGSDFDVDKLNTYLNNWKLDKFGLPYYEQFKDDSNSDVNERYVDYVRNNTKDYSDIVSEMRASSEYLARRDKIYTANTDINAAIEETDATKAVFNNEYVLGSAIFSQLPLSVKQQFWQLADELEADDDGFINDQAAYYNFTQQFISQFDDADGITLSFTRKNKQGIINTYEEEVYGTDVIPVFQEMLENYIRVVDKLGVNKAAFDKLRGLVGKASNFELAKVIAESTGLPTVEDFGERPMYLQNTKGAVENEYFQSMRNVLKAKENFIYLLSPNSVSHIRKNRNHVYKALGFEGYDGLTDEQINDDAFMINFEGKKELDYTNFLSTEYIAQKRNEFTKGKSDIGIFAVAMTNFANSQVTGLVIAGRGGTKDGAEDYILDTLNERYYSLPFEDIEMHEINGELVIPLSRLQDASGALTMDKISAYINGAVDVAKEPLIVQMGMHTELAGVYTILERMGMRGETVALFLHQPVVREFLRETLFLNTKTYFGTSVAENYSKLLEKFVKDFQPAEFKYDPNFKFTDTQLAHMIRKGEAIKRGEGSWNAKEYEMQYYAFITYLKAKMYANHLIENIQSSNHDTASIRNAYILVKKELQLERSKTGNTIVQINNDGEIKNGSQALRDDTAVGTDIKMLDSYAKVFADIGLFKLQTQNPRATLLTIAGRIFRENPYITNEKFIAVMRQYEASMVDSLTMQIEIAGEDQAGNTVLNPLYKFTKQFFSTDYENTLKKRKEALEAKYPTFFRDNYFLSNLDITTDRNLGVDKMELKKKPRNSDITTKEKITFGMIELASLDPVKYKDLVEFYSAVIYGAYIQYGIKFSRKSFVDLIPVSNSRGTNVLSLTDLTGPALEDIQDEDFTTFDELVRRSKYWVDGVVNQRSLMAVNVLQPVIGNPGKLQLSEKARWRMGKQKGGKLPVITQVFFGQRDSEGEMRPHIYPITIWGGYEGTETKWEQMEEIISVRAVKPEFLVRKERGYGVAKIVDKMIKAGDYSWSFTQLFKKVGINDHSLARKYVSKAGKNDLKSVAYLYKPINKYGARDFGEQIPLEKREDGSTFGKPSIMNFPLFVEQEDQDIIDNTVDPKGFLAPATDIKVNLNEGPVVTSRQKPVKKGLKPSSAKVFPMDGEAARKVALGQATISIKSVAQADEIKIKTGKFDTREIAGDLYRITNRGHMTIKQAGGLKAVMAQSGLTGTELSDNPMTKEWLEGKRGLYIYDIEPVEALAPDGLPPIEPIC